MDGYVGSSYGTNCASPSVEIFYDESGRKINLRHYEANVEGYDGCLVAISNHYATNFINSSFVEWLGLSCIPRELPYKFRGLGKSWFLDHNLPIDVKWNRYVVDKNGRVHTLIPKYFEDKLVARQDIGYGDWSEIQFISPSPSPSGVYDPYTMSSPIVSFDACYNAPYTYPPPHYQYQLQPLTTLQPPQVHQLLPYQPSPQPRQPLTLPPQHTPQAPPRRDDLSPPPPIPPQEPRMMNNPLFQHDHETTLNELDNIQQVFNDEYKGDEVNQRGRGQTSLRISLKNAKRHKDERQKKQRSEGDKSDNSRVEKGEKAWSELSDLVDCGDILSLTDSYDIDEFDISLSCDEKNNCCLQLAKSSCALLDNPSSLFNVILASDDVESYDKPPLWDDESDNSFDTTLTLLEESFELYEEMSQEECVDEFFDSISIPLEERFNFYDEMSKC
ncbi:hypothetical protein A4A49_15734 [Nicotiana attenuata]|uniref:Uncharacterized protein n=1 Tax=Nicotiana attenuata TaxID=49451 RepID=A0A1J6JEX5_NICAT|nr:hypothetical protein A4A49_15734 [Nicotiana attenuata]